MHSADRAPDSISRGRRELLQRDHAAGRPALDKSQIFDSYGHDSERCGSPSECDRGFGLRRRLAMGRAEIASACARPDSIKGLAQSIARPAYRRLLNAEPALRRAVPALIVAFLVTVGIGAVIQAFAHRNQAIADVVEDVELVAEILSDRLDQAAGDSRSDVAVPVQRAMERGLPRLASAPSRWLMVPNPS